jgi:3-oxoacyl-[acyl-carrier protein] reductase
MQVDLTDPAAPARIVATTVELLGGIDILVNNAGTFIYRGLLDLTQEDWDSTLATNLSAPFFLLQAVARVMVEQRRGGAIVNIASIHGKVAEAEVAAQAAAKSGLIGLTQAAAAALRDHDIRVNAVCPGAIEPDSPDRLSLTPRNKVTQGDVATLVAYLVSDLAGPITGSAIDVFGSTHTEIKG